MTAAAQRAAAVAPLVVAVDCSTTAAKAIVVDAAGRVASFGAHAIETATPGPHRFEQDAQSWWSATDAAVQQALAGLSDTAAVTAVCITHQRESFVCVDEHGRPLRPAMLWMDGRAGSQVARFGSPRVEQLCGKPADITPGLYKLAWLKENEPSVLTSAHRVVDVHGFLVHQLTGRWTSSTASIDPLALLDVATGEYADELLDIAGVRREQLPDLVPVGASLGPLRSQVASAWSLHAGVEVIAGLGDGQAAGLGADVTRPGRAYLVLGTAVVIGSENPGYAPSRAYRSMVSAVPHQTTVETFSSSGTHLPTWFRREFGPPELAGRPDAALEAAADAVPVGSQRLLTLPYWNAAQTPHWDAHVSGATLGWRSHHTRAHLYRSLLEGIAMELRLQLEGLEDATGSRVEVLRAMGGGARSPLWTQMLADVLGRPLQLCAAGEVSALGAAAVALTGIGVHGCVSEAAAVVASTDGQVEPRPEAVAQYAALIPAYRGLYGALRDVLHTVDALPEAPLTRASNPCKAPAVPVTTRA